MSLVITSQIMSQAKPLRDRSCWDCFELLGKMKWRILLKLPEIIDQLRMKKMNYKWSALFKVTNTHWRICCLRKVRSKTILFKNLATPRRAHYLLKRGAKLRRAKAAPKRYDANLKSLADQHEWADEDQKDQI